MYDGRSLGGCQVEPRVSGTPAYHSFLFVLFIGYCYDAYVYFVFTSCLAWPSILAYILGAIVTLTPMSPRIQGLGRPFHSINIGIFWEVLCTRRMITARILGIFVSHFCSPILLEHLEPPFFFPDLRRISVLMYDIIPTYDTMTTNTSPPSPALSTYHRYFGI